KRAILKWIPFARKRQPAAPQVVRPHYCVPFLERLEPRRLFAIITPFSRVFSTIANGNIAIIGNTVVTAPASNPNAGNAQNGVGSVLDWSDFTPMASVNVANAPPAPANSSSATLNPPAGSTVLFAGLFWGGYAKGYNTTQLRTVGLAA